MKEKKVRIYFSLPVYYVRILDAEAKQRGMSRNKLIEEILTIYLYRFKKEKSR